MTPIGELVDEVYTCMTQEDTNGALRQLYEMLQLTAKKRNHMDVVSVDMAKGVLSEQMWMILPMGCAYVQAINLKLPVRVQGIEPDADGYTALDEILYQAMEDAARGVANNILWIKNRGFVQQSSGEIALNTALIWGIMLALVICPENRGEQTDDYHWISIGTLKTFINELWGREDIVCRAMLMEFGVERYVREPERIAGD